MTKTFDTLLVRARDGTMTGRDLAIYARTKGRALTAADVQEIDRALAQYKAECEPAVCAADRFIAMLQAFDMPS